METKKTLSEADFTTRTTQDEELHMTYEEAFLHPVAHNDPQAVLISKELYFKISQYAHVFALLGEPISVDDFVENAMTWHFKAFKEFLNDLSREAFDNLP